MIESKRWPCFLLAIALAFVLLLGLFPTTARAATHTVANEAGLRAAIASCTNATAPDTITITQTINLATPLTIPAGANITITSTATNALLNTSGQTITVDGSLTVANTGGIGIWIIGGGALTVASGGSLTVANTGGTGIHVDGTLNNSGTITNTGTINNNVSGKINNSGTIGNSGKINNDGGGTINNNGGGTIGNSGTITNNNNSIINNNSTINNYAGGTLDNGNGSTVTNNSTINNYAGGTLDNDGIFNNNSGTINNNNGTINGTIVDSPPDITTATLPGGTVGSAYFQTLAADNSPTSWLVTIGSLPVGLVFDSNNQKISGTPTTAGTFTFAIVATNARGSHTKNFSITISSASIGSSNSSGWSPPDPVSPAKPVAETKAAFPAQGEVTGKRINVYKYEKLRTTLFRLNKGDGFTILGLASGGKALHIEHDGREGYIAIKDITAEFGAAIRATALKKAAAYVLWDENGKLTREGYFDKGQTLWVHGIWGKYLINKQTNATYYLDAGQWVLAEAPPDTVR